MDNVQIKDKFQLLLQKFQDLSRTDTLEKFVFLLDPKQRLLCKGLIAWKNIKTTLDFSTYKDIQDQLEFIWQFARVDIKSYCTILQISQGQAISLINRLKKLNLIFPDGTVNTTAYGVLITFSKNQVQKRTGMKNKKDEQK